MALEKHYTIPETVELLGCCKDTVLILCRTGQLYATKAGRSWRIPESGIKAYYDNRRVVPPEPKYLFSTSTRKKAAGTCERITLADISPKGAIL